MSHAWAETLPKGISVLASDLVQLVGAERLVGLTVETPNWCADDNHKKPCTRGCYPGGKAVVTEVAHDTAAPDIVFMVKHPTFGDMGIFEYEEVYLTHPIETRGLNHGTS